MKTKAPKCKEDSEVELLLAQFFSRPLAKPRRAWDRVFQQAVQGFSGADGDSSLLLDNHRSLWLFGVVQVVSILGFAVLADTGPVLWLLAAVISFEYLGVGMGTAAFTAFIARETSKTFAATQFALFTALAALPRTFANASTGIIVEWIGWLDFFLLCALLALPGMLLLVWVAPWNEDQPARQPAGESG